MQGNFVFSVHHNVNYTSFYSHRIMHMVWRVFVFCRGIKYFRFILPISFTADVMAANESTLGDICK